MPRSWQVRTPDCGEEMIKRSNFRHLLPALRFTAAAIVLITAHRLFSEPRPVPVEPDSESNAVALNLPHYEVVGGAYLIGQVQLNQPAPVGGAKVKVSSNTKLVKVSPLTPSSLLIPAGSTTVSFKLITSPVEEKTQAILSVTYGSATGSVKLTLDPNGVASITAVPATLQWGGTASVEVRLKDNAPQDVPYYKNMAPTGAPAMYEPEVQKGGAKVVLKSSNPAISVPASVNVSPGDISAKFTATASQPSSCSAGPASPATATITATWEQPQSSPLKVGDNSNNESRYTSKTIRIDPKTIIGVSHDAHALVLDGSDKCVQSLTAGSVMLIRNLGVLQVKKTIKTPEKQLAVAVSDAGLTDFINEGTFQVFSQTLGPASQPSGPWTKGLIPEELQSGSDIWKYKVSGTSSSY